MAQRSYEVSIWTLQDEFISVLKASNVENKGQISEPKTIIKDDGTLELKFSLPMYLYEGKEKIVNPLWCNTTNGNLIEDTRKIKLTFNKDTSVTKTFEFIILEVTDKHENDQLYCEVSCEGMAFHELGKRGYKISLTSDDFYNEDYEAFKQGQGNSAPHATLQYWLNKFLTPKPTNGDPIDKNVWYYEVQMDWSSYDNANLRDSHKIYEDIYISSWRYDDNSATYKPDTVTSLQEKERMVDLEESNIYNLTQDLAEIFGVFCKYEYLYDVNLHIIGRTIIFYNNYLQEKPQNEIGSYIDITYPYSTSAITRTRDGKDVTTKMFVRPADDNISPSGMITIMDVAANKSQEDYLLNFDYMYSIGSISAEQYAAVPKFEAQIGQLNRQLRAIEGPMMAIENNIPELEAAITLHNNAIALDTERINNCNNLINELTSGTGDINVDATRPITAILIESSKPAEEGNYYININEHGVKAETLQIFKTYNFSTSPNLHNSLSDELTGWVPKYDEFGNLYRVNFLSKSGPADSSTVYLTYTYRPRLYYDNILNTWTTRLAQDREARDNATTELEDVNTRLNTLKQQWENINSSKKVLLDDFEKMMGAALRESYWQPDDFRDYGDSYSDSYSFSASSGASNLSSFVFDETPFDGEQLGYYKFGVNETITYYPVIDLSGKEAIIKNDLDNNINLIFYDIDSSPTTKDLRTFALGSQMQLGYINYNNTIKPVLIITDVENLTEASIKRMVDNGFIGKISSDESGGNYSITVTSLIDAANINFINAITSSDPYTFSNPHIVYPRIKIDSLSLKTDDEHLMISINNNPLKNYENYSVLERDDTNWTDPLNYSASYYISIKPINFIKYYNANTSIICHFNISNADVSIYLDALQVLKENAYPKVSYTVEPSAINKDFLYTLYNKLNYICNINDTDLKFKNVQGYISELELDCDFPWNDKIVIKNYKTKFEDLFSTIVAQTESMKKNSYAIALASSAFTATGTLDDDLMQNTLRRIDLDYAFNNGNLTINESEGIWGTSDDGVVAIRGGGIFTATEKDNNGNWKWNTGIVPQGINADLITTGQLDTNRIKVYAGDQLKFQLNGTGLYAYKSWIGTESATANWNSLSNEVKNLDLDTKQYVVHNADGLFLVAEEGAYILKKNGQFHQMTQTVERVAISWNGLTLRNYNNVPVFEADADTGDLKITGALTATELSIINNGTTQTIDEYINIGATNLLPRAAIKNGSYSETGSFEILSNTKSGFGIRLPSTETTENQPSFGWFVSAELWSNDKFIEDEYYTLSFKAKTSSDDVDLSIYYYDEAYQINNVRVGQVSPGTITLKRITTTVESVVIITKFTWATSPTTLKLCFKAEKVAGHSSTTVDIWDIKLERGNKATDWSAYPEELNAGSTLAVNQNGITMTTGSNINMTGSNINMSSGNITMLADGSINMSGTGGITLESASELFNIDPSGSTMNNLTVNQQLLAPNIAYRYTGDNISITSSGPYKSLNTFFKAINNNVLDYDLTITLKIGSEQNQSYDIYEDVYIGGLSGIGQITINGQQNHTIHGNITIRNPGVYVRIINTTIDGRIDISDTGFVKLDNVVITSSNVCASIFRGAKVAFNNCFFSTSSNQPLIYMEEGAILSANKVVGGSSGNPFISAINSIITWRNERPVGTVDIGACLTSPADLSTLTPSSGGSSPINPTTIYTTTFSCINSRSMYGNHWYNAVGNVSETRLRQGYTGNNPQYGYFWFDTSSLSGTTIKSATLTLTRVSGYGRASEVHVKLCKTDYTYTNGWTTPSAESYQPNDIGTIANGETKTFVIDTSIISANSTMGLKLNTEENSYIAGRGYSTNYAHFYGFNENEHEAEAPILTVTYTISST